MTHSEAAIAAYPDKSDALDIGTPIRIAELRSAFDRGRAEALAEVRPGMPGVHWECDCVPDLGPTHCHACGDIAGRIVEWSQAVHAPLPVVVSDSTKPSEHMKIIRKKALAEASFVVYAYFEKIMQRETAGTDPWYVAQNASVELQGLIDGLFTDDLALLSDSTALIEEARGWHYDTDPELMETLTGRLLAALAALHPTSEGDN